MTKGPTIRNFRRSSGAIFVALIFGTIHLPRHQRKGSFEMLRLDCCDGEEKGGAPDVCKCTRIRNTFNRFRNKKQRSTELTEFALHFLKEKERL